MNIPQHQDLPASKETTAKPVGSIFRNRHVQAIMTSNLLLQLGIWVRNIAILLYVTEITNNGTISYQCDALNQMTQETLIHGTTIAYTYDKVGNRTSKAVTKAGVTTTTGQGI